MEDSKILNRLRTALRSCYQKTNVSYLTQGKLGINVCDEWRHNPGTFVVWARANGWTGDEVLVRKNQDQDYTPDNCVMMNRKEYYRTHRSKLKVSVNGKPPVSVRTAFEEIGNNSISLPSVYNRIYRGWDIDKALTQPRISRHKIRLSNVLP